MITDPTGNHSASGNMFGFVSNHMINDCLKIPSNTSIFSNQLLTVIGTVNAFDIFCVVISVIYFITVKISRNDAEGLQYFRKGQPYCQVVCTHT